MDEGINANELPGDFEALFKEGTALLHEGKSVRALPYLEKAHTARPEDVDTGINLAGAYILSKKFSKAVDILEPLSEANSDNAMIWTNLGAAYLGNPVLASEKHQRRAISAFERALDLNPVAPSVAYNIGLVYRDLNEPEEAMVWFERAIQNDPRDQHARNILRKLQREQQAPDNE